MKIFAPAGYITLVGARDELSGRMHAGLQPSPEIESYRREGFCVIDGRKATAAARELRNPILSGELGLFAVLSSRPTPMRIHNSDLLDAALLPRGSKVLTFVYCDRQLGAPFGLSWPEFKELMKDPLCLEVKPFRAWLRQTEKRRNWPCHSVEPRRQSHGRPSKLRDDVIEIIEELDKEGRLSGSMLNKQVQALVQSSRPSLREVSEETVRRARKEANINR